METSVFGAKFVALKNGMETMRGLRYKLRMMSIPIEGPAFAYGNNMSVIHNTHKTTRVYVKEKVEFRVLPFLQRAGCYDEQMHNWTCAYKMKPSQSMH